MTNYEKIKAMSVEEMAEWFAYMAEGECVFCPALFSCEYDEAEGCKGSMKKYLESEVEENMLPEICSCGYRFEADETICSNCGKKVEEDG